MGNSVFVLSAGLEFFFAVVSVILLVGCLFDQDRGRPVNRMTVAILVVHALMNGVDACIWLWSDVASLLPLMKGLGFLSYALGCAIFALFACMLVCYIREYARVPAWVMGCIVGLSVVMALLWVVSLFNGMYYYWDENGACQLGKLYFLSQLFGVAFLVGNIALVLAYRKALKRRDCAVLILYSAIPLFSFVFVPLWDVVPVYAASTISLLLYYTVVHVEHGQRMAQAQIRLAQQALELSNSRTAIMLSQIQPHFLYNALEAVGYLCKADPKVAEETVTRFSMFLRGNMEALTHTGTISFEQELAHTNNYLYLEKARFEERLNVTYDIRAKNFRLPPLTLQPIVENAVRYGVTKREDGGCVAISTRETKDGFTLTVSDDGVGFDPALPHADGRTHIGIDNVRERVAALLGGTLEIRSVPNVGTTATITIPKEAGEHENTGAG